MGKPCIDYTYDNLSRLLETDYDSGSTVYSYGYDLSGNLVDNNGVTNTFNSANQLTGNGTDTYDYDANGNLWKTNSVVSHTWDRANRLLSHGGLDYAYDGLGNRISQDNGVDVTKYLLDLQSGLPKVLSETVGSNVTCFVHSPRGLHATQNPADAWFYSLQDGLGSQRAEIGATATVVGSQEFTPYGVVQNVSGTFNSPHAFTGEPLDANGLQYHRARYMNPTMGGFLSLDPLETPNRYAYANGNPVNRIDRTGMFDESTCTVEAGDYLEGIGVQVGVQLSNGRYVPGYGRATNAQLAEVRQLMRSYNPQRPQHIFPGDKLNIPPNRKGVKCPKSSGVAGRFGDVDRGVGVLHAYNSCPQVGARREPEPRNPIDDFPPPVSGIIYDPPTVPICPANHYLAVNYTTTGVPVYRCLERITHFCNEDMTSCTEKRPFQSQSQQASPCVGLVNLIRELIQDEGIDDAIVLTALEVELNRNSALRMKLEECGQIVSDMFMVDCTPSIPNLNQAKDLTLHIAGLLANIPQLGIASEVGFLTQVDIVAGQSVNDNAGHILVDMADLFGVSFPKFGLVWGILKTEYMLIDACFGNDLVP